ncbi:FAD dependent oxidoreductase [Colletotrichum incanum]|nr:FAD dependent oxidoreductase [Colletotrichum incanum]
MTSKSSPVFIVGAGVFGLSLAYELAANRGYTSVTVLDRFLPPVPDGSSVDVSRIIRTEYADPLYSSLATDALQGWRTSEVYKPHYHESGFVMMANEKERPSPYFEKYRQWRGETKGGEKPLEFFEPPNADAEVKRLYKGVQADLREFAATHNTAGGWADAAGAIRALAGKCTLAGVSFVTGAHGTVVSLQRSGGRVTGVRTAAGTRLDAEKVVLAAGAWTNRIVPGVGHAVAASGQPVGFIRLSDEEAERVRDMPVMVNMSTGVFCFPPTPGTNLLKVARHGFGYATEFEAEVADQDKKERKVSSPSAFKFLPVIGTHVADCFERKASTALREKWRLRRPVGGETTLRMAGDGSRAGPALRKLTPQEQAKL